MKWVRFSDKYPPVGEYVCIKLHSLELPVLCVGKHDGEKLLYISESGITKAEHLWWVKVCSVWWLDENPDNREVYKCGPECKSGVRLRLVLNQYDQLKFDYDKIENENKQLREMLNSIDNTIKPWKSLLKS